MKIKILSTIQLLVIAVVLPLLAKPHVLLAWPIIFITVYGAVLNMSQPAMNLKKDGATAHDRNSMHAILIGALLCFIIPICDYAYGTRKDVELGQTATIVGICMIVGGFLFRFWSIRVLGRFFTSKVQIQSDHQLVKDGPYQWLRHPSYTGAWISQLGISTLLQSRYGLVFCIFVYFPIYIYRIECEEKALKETFPDAYGQYQLHTSKMFPFLY